MSKERLKISQILPNYLDIIDYKTEKSNQIGGVFRYIDFQYSSFFSQYNLDPFAMDYDYYLHSYSKIVTRPIAEIYTNADGETTYQTILDDEGQVVSGYTFLYSTITYANLIYNRYKDRWSKLLATYKLYLDSNLLANKNYTKTSAGSDNKNENENIDTSHSDTSSTITNNDIYGFNSTSSVPASNSTVDNTTDTTEKKSKASSDNTAERQYTEENTLNGFENTTASGLFNEAMNTLRNGILEQIYRDVDNLLTIKVY